MLKDKLENVIQEIYQPIKEIINDKNFKKYFITLIIVYLIGYASILIADVYYLDDLGRSMHGRRWPNFSRHLSDKASILVHMGWKLSDISPLTQLIAVFILSTTSILLVKIINGRLRFIPIIASTCIGLFPFFLQNISYKFDSPYMAFSLLSSVVPFLYYYNKKKSYFITFSILGVLGTFMTYQAAGGVYLILFIALLTKDFLLQKNTIKEFFVSIGIVLVSYTIALLIYRYLFMEDIHPNSYHQVSTSVFPLLELPKGVYYHIINRLSIIKNAFSNGFIAYALLCLLALYIVKLLLLSKRTFLISVIVALLSLGGMISLSWGGYIVLENLHFPLRAYLGFGLLVALLLSIEIENNKLLQMINRIFVVVFIYALIVFANAYGNALKAQNEYNNFRFKMAVYDLSKFISSKDKSNKLKLQFLNVKNRQRYSPVVLNASYHYPLIKQLAFNKGRWKNIGMMKNIGMPTIGVVVADHLCPKNVGKTILYSTTFHDIAKAKESDCYYIIFK